MQDACPRSNRPLAIVQMDHTLVDIMVVDEMHRQSMGRPWVTVSWRIPCIETSDKRLWTSTG
jgi:putative transposase